MSAVTGNYASYISYKHNHFGSQTAIDSWYYDVNKVCPLGFTLAHCLHISTCLSDTNARFQAVLKKSHGRLAIQQYSSMAMLV